jgi:multiple sugar transport system permease protein
MRQKTYSFLLEKGDLLTFLLMLPTLLIVVCIIVVPLCYGIFLTFFNVGFNTIDYCADFFGIKNYIRFFSDTLAYRAILNTLCFSFGAIFGDLFLGTIFAVLLVNIPRLLASILRPIITIPLLISSVVVGLIWRYIYNPTGILYWIFGLFGLGLEDFPGVTSPSTALISTVVAHWWQVTPFVIIVLTAGLLSIPEELYEAVKIDGAGAFTTFFRITFPHLQSVYMVILLISGVDTIKVFDIIYALTGGGPHNSSISLSIFAYSQAFEQSQLSYSMVISIMTMILMFIIFGIPFIKYNIGKGNK